MGTDKAALWWQGATLLEHSVRAVSEVVTEVVVVGPERAGLNLSVTYVREPQPGLGPLGGAVAGLQEIGSDRAFVAGCDMPLLSPSLIEHLLAALEPGDDAVVPVLNGILQPLHAVYARSAIAGLASQLQAAVPSKRSLLAALDNLHARRVAEEELQQHDPHLLSFTSIDTPHDWRRLLADLEEHRGLA